MSDIRREALLCLYNSPCMSLNFDINLLLLPLLALMGVIWLAEIARARFFPASVSNRSKIPWWLDYSRSFFPVLLLVVVIRSFIAEPYQIPSSSMLPTLRGGDFILVNKFHYGLRLPLGNHEFLRFKQPQRGDVLVFRFPHQPSIRYIKRVIGMPGDHVLYINKTLYINGKEIAQEPYFNDFVFSDSREKLIDEKSYGIRGYHLAGSPPQEWQVPFHHYFVMGDNRDNSNDSRYWGFVPHSEIVGKAVYIWMSWTSWRSLPSFRRNAGL